MFYRSAVADNVFTTAGYSIVANFWFGTSAEEFPTTGVCDSCKSEEFIYYKLADSAYSYIRAAGCSFLELTFSLIPIFC